MVIFFFTPDLEEKSLRFYCNNFFKLKYEIYNCSVSIRIIITKIDCRKLTVIIVPNIFSLSIIESIVSLRQIRLIIILKSEELRFFEKFIMMNLLIYNKYFYFASALDNPLVQ